MHTCTYLHSFESDNKSAWVGAIVAKWMSTPSKVLSMPASRQTLHNAEALFKVLQFRFEAPSRLDSTACTQSTHSSNNDILLQSSVF